MLVTTAQQWEIREWRSQRPTPAQVNQSKALLSNRVLDLTSDLVVAGLRGDWSRLDRGDVSDLIRGLKAADRLLNDTKRRR
jgi:hypothetical protein